MKNFQLDNEQLQEWLLDLIRTNELGQLREMHATALLDVIQEIGQRDSSDAVLDTLLQGLQIITGYQEFAILEPRAKQPGFWACAHASTPSLDFSLWQQDQAFERALKGECLSLFKPEAISEFAEQDQEILVLSRAAMIFAVHTNLKQRLVLLLKQDKTFSTQHQQAVQRLRPIAEQRLQNLEFEQKLYDMVTQRTEALKVSQHRMASFINMSSDWFWEVDDELRFSYAANPNHPEGDHFQQLLLGKSILEVRSAKEKTRLNKWFHITRMLQQRKSVEQFEIELQLPNRGAAWVRVSAEPFFNEQGNFSGYRGVATNITDFMSHSSELSQQLQKFSDQQAEAEKEEKAPLTLEQKTKILLVDDCKSTQMITQLMLINLGYSVTVAENGNQALESSDLGGYALILMDLEMPDLSGEEVCQQMRGQGVETPIIALSACSYSARHAQTQEAGMNGYIEKPVRLNLLKSKLDEFLTEPLMP